MLRLQCTMGRHLQVNEKNELCMTKALEQAAKDTEDIKCLTAQLTQLETDKVLCYFHIHCKHTSMS